MFVRCVQNGAWKWYLTPLVIFLAAFFVRYHFLITFDYAMMVHEQDAVGYIAVAKQLLHWQPVTVTGRPPGYPFIIALFALLPVGMEFAARLASIFMDALITLPLYALAYRLLPPVGAAAAALLWAFFGFALAFSTSPLTQSTFLFFLLAAILLLTRSVSMESSRLPLMVGVCIGYAYLTRPEGIVVILFVAPLVATVRLAQNRKAYRRILKDLVLLGLGFMVLVGPFLTAYRYQAGHWALTNKSAAAVKTQDGVVTLNARGELAASPEGLALWKEYYGTFSAFVTASGTNAIQFARAYLQVVPLWAHLLALSGLLALLWQRRFIELVCLTPLLAVTLPNYIVNISKSNSYNYPLFPLLFIGVAAGCEALRRLVLKVVPGEPGRILVAFSYLVVVSPVAVLSFLGYIEADATYRSPGLVQQAELSDKIFRGAGDVIKSYSRPGEVIMTRWGLIGYFADRPVVTLPKGQVADVVNYGRKHNVSFLIIDTMSVFTRREELEELLDPLYGKPLRPDYGLELLATINHDVGGCVIYRYVR